MGKLLTAQPIKIKVIQTCVTNDVEKLKIEQNEITAELFCEN